MARPLDGPVFIPPPRRGIDGRLLAGALVFGIGWGLSGICPGPAITALVLRAMLESGKTDTQSPEIKKGFDKLLTYQLDNGGIFKDLQGTYNTAIAISPRSRT